MPIASFDRILDFDQGIKKSCHEFVRAKIHDDVSFIGRVIKQNCRQDPTVPIYFWKVFQ